MIGLDEVAGVEPHDQIMDGLIRRDHKKVEEE